MSKSISVLKMFAYALLAVTVYLEFIGPQGLAEILHIDSLIDKKIEIANNPIPKNVVALTVLIAILECASNVIDVFFKRK